MSHHQSATAIGQDGSASTAAGACPRPYGVLPLESKISGRSSGAGVVPNNAVGGAAGGAFSATGGGGGQTSKEISFERLKTLMKAGETANGPSHEVTRAARAAAILTLKKDFIGFKLQSYFLKKLEVKDPKFLKFYDFNVTSRDEAKAEEAALLAVELPEQLLSPRHKRDNADTVKIAVLFKIRGEIKIMSEVWRTALSAVADEIAQADALPVDARDQSVWALVKQHFKANRGAKTLPSALAIGLGLVAPLAAVSAVNADAKSESNEGAKEKVPAKAQRSSDAAKNSDRTQSSLDSNTAMPSAQKAGATAAGDTKKGHNDQPIDGEKVAATGGGVNGKEKLVNQAATTTSATATSALPSPSKPPCAPLSLVPVVVGPERKPGDPPSYTGGLTVVSLAPVHNIQQAPHGFWAFWPQE